jgi:hypothetical protein
MAGAVRRRVWPHREQNREALTIQHRMAFPPWSPLRAVYDVRIRSGPLRASVPPYAMDVRLRPLTWEARLSTPLAPRARVRGGGAPGRGGRRGRASGRG